MALRRRLDTSAPGRWAEHDQILHVRTNSRKEVVYEGVIVETASERVAWLNDAVAVGKGTLEGSHLTIELFLITS
jgi:hypothetical protein